MAWFPDRSARWREFPDWTVYRGTDQRWRARPEAATPPVEPVVGEDLADLRDQIKAADTSEKI